MSDPQGQALMRGSTNVPLLLSAYARARAYVLELTQAPRWLPLHVLCHILLGSFHPVSMHIAMVIILIKMIIALIIVTMETVMILIIGKASRPKQSVVWNSTGAPAVVARCLATRAAREMCVARSQLRCAVPSAHSCCVDRSAHGLPCGWLLQLA